MFYDPANVGSLISGSSVCSKPSLDTWQCAVPGVLTPGLEGFEPTLLAQRERSCPAVKCSLVLPFLGTGMRTDLFQSCGHCWVFQFCWHVQCSTWLAPSFRMWTSSAGIPSPPPASLAAVLPKARLTSHPRTSGSERLHIVVIQII